MTTKLATYMPGHFASADRVFRHLPALFNDNWLNSVFDDVEKAFDVPNAVYPYNVVQVTNSAKEVTEYRVEVALAGVGKENIDVKVREGKLQINVLYSKDETPETVSYLKKGISQRKGNLVFNLDEKVNAKRITSSYKDGLLQVVIPVVQSETIDVDVEVK